MNESHGHYAYEIHGAADEHHRHYEIAGLREDLNRALERIREMEDRTTALERDTPQARRLQYEADLAAADLAESGYDEPEPEDYDPGPELDDEGGMSEHRHAGLGEEPW